MNENEINIFKLMRVVRGITAKELAKRLHVSGSYIHAIETGDRKPSKKLYSKYLEALQFDDEIIKKFIKQSKKCTTYEQSLYCLLKLICK